jgi:hypothetical protein
MSTPAQHVGAQGPSLANTSAQLFLIPLIRHKFTGPDAGPCPIRQPGEAYSHTHPASAPVLLSVAQGIQGVPFFPVTPSTGF